MSEPPAGGADAGKQGTNRGAAGGEWVAGEVVTGWKSEEDEEAETTLAGAARCGGLMGSRRAGGKAISPPEQAPCNG